MKTMGLTISQKQLVAAWENELLGFQRGFGSVINELMLFRLEKIARELGIDVDNEQWTFDFQAKRFTKKEEKQEVTEIIPSSKKRGRPKKEDEILEAEIVEDDSQLDIPG